MRATGPDSIERLARALAIAHPTLDDVLITDVAVWRRVVAAAIAGSAPYRTLLLGVRPDLSLRADALIRGTDHAVAKRKTSSAIGAIQPLRDLTDAGHALGPTRQCGADDFANRYDFVHADTVPAPAAMQEVA